MRHFTHARGISELTGVATLAGCLIPNPKGQAIKMQCVLCDITTTNQMYDLSNHNSLCSETPLLFLLQNCVQKAIVLSHYNICKSCYNLLNEFDQLQLRTKAIQEQLNTYITKDNLCKRSTNNIISVGENELDMCLKTELQSSLDDSINAVSNVRLENPSTSMVDITTEETISKTLRTEKQQLTASHSLKSQNQNDTNNPLECAVCCKLFKSKAELRNHALSHDTERPYICEICGQVYKQQKALDIHINMHRGIFPFTCTYCNKTFTQKGALVRHLPLHTGQKPYQCDVCGKRFIHHTSFNIHKISHSGEKSYKCEICGLLLISKSHLTRHKKVHTGEKKYSCSTCGKKFAERYNLGVHERGHAQGRISAVSKKFRYRCRICHQASFDRRETLEEHMIIHHTHIMNINGSTVKIETSEMAA